MRFGWGRVTQSTRRIAYFVLSLIVIGIVIVNSVPAIEKVLLTQPTTCTLKIFTGIPCLGCRGTRAGFALAHGQIVKAIQFNPFATALGVFITGWSLWVSFSGKLPIFSVSRPWRTLGWTLFGVALAGNWIYVIAVGG